MNKNHPKKGSRITVDPIRNIKDIKKIKRKLRNNPRDLLLFTLGVNNGLRISDLLSLRVGDVRELEIGQTLNILETKTGKMNVLMVNKETRKVLDAFLNEARPEDEDYLFKSRKGVNYCHRRKKIPNAPFQSDASIECGHKCAGLQLEKCRDLC